MTDELFKDRWCLLDTNILSEMAKEKRAEKFKPVFEFLKENNTELFCLNSTVFEFIGFSPIKKDYEKLKNWIQRIPVVDVRKEDSETATLISSLYKNIDPNIHGKQISYCDCLHASQITKFKGKAFLVTTDIHDYPVSLFDISKIMVIDEGSKAVLVAFITFNQEKWAKANDKFDQTA